MAQSMFDEGEYPSIESALRASTNEIATVYSGKKNHEHHAFNIQLTQKEINIGIIVITIFPDRNQEQISFVDYISVHPEYQRQGYAHQAMIEMEKLIKKRALTPSSLML